MDSTKLQEFVTNAAARSRITFGDLRRLQRGYLPDGVSTREQAEMLIQLDGVVGRADKAWTDWLVAAIVDFAVGSEQPTDGVGMREWLKDFLAATGASTKATRRIVREIHRHAGHIEPMIAFPTSENSAAAQAAHFDARGGIMNRLELAA